MNPIVQALELIPLCRLSMYLETLLVRLASYATIKDNVLDKRVDVYFREDGGAFCDSGNLEDCHHIDYILSLTSVQRVLDYRGWKRKDS